MPLFSLQCLQKLLLRFLSRLECTLAPPQVFIYPGQIMHAYFSSVCHLMCMLRLSAVFTIAALHDAPCCSMRAGDPPTFKRSAPLSSTARPQAAFGLQKAPRRGAVSSVTQGRSSAAAAGAFLPPQLKGRSASHDQPRCSADVWIAEPALHAE